MRQIRIPFLLFFFIWISTRVMAQITTVANGNVGIGTTTPQAKLDISGTSNVETYLTATGDGLASMSFKSNGQKFMWSKRGANESNAFCLFYYNGTTFTYPEFIHVQTNGNIGISTSTPTERLSVGGNIQLSGKIYWSWANRTIEEVAQPDGQSVVMRFRNSMYSTESNPNGGFDFAGQDGTSVMRIVNGHVGIGTASVNDANYKLFVETGIRTRKIKVDQSTWPDYVFDNKYILCPLGEVESFLKKFQHLPDVPSAAEVTKDGIDLGANQAVLLKKIEELTLYLIEQNKQLAEQRQLLEAQQRRIDVLERKGVLHQ